MSERQRKWNKYEAVILLEGLLEVLEGKASRSEVIKRVSADLRKMARQQGEDIDDVFRNENGISFQINRMKSALKGYAVHGISSTKLFDQVADIYRTDRQEYEKLLKEAKKMSETKSSNKDEFIAWSASVISESRHKWITQNLEIVENFGKKCGLISTSIYDITDVETLDKLYFKIRKSKIFGIQNRLFAKCIIEAFLAYIEFVSEKSKEETASSNNIIDQSKENEISDENRISNDNEDGRQDGRYEKILKTYFKKGFRLDSTIEIQRFKQRYKDLYDVETEESSTAIVREISNICVLCNDKAYHPDVMLSADIKDKLLEYIDDCLNNEKNVYVDAILEKFNDNFIDYPLYKDPAALKAYLTKIAGNRFYVNRGGFVSRQPFAESNSADEIKSFLRERCQPVEFDELLNELSYLSEKKIRQVLSDDDDIICNEKGKQYFHISAVDLSDSDIKKIEAIINQAIEQSRFISAKELYKSVQEKYPYIIEKNNWCTVDGFRDVVKLKLKMKFSFYGNVISAQYNYISKDDIFNEFVRGHESFTMSDLDSLADELGIPYRFELVCKNSIRVSKDRFVKKESIHFDTAQIDSALDSLCVQDYISIARINNFIGFPTVETPWNSFLLESYAASFSKKYTLVHMDFSKSKCAGALVKRSSNINSMDDFIVRYLTDSDVELSKEIVLKKLFDEGYIGSRSYTRIDNLVIRAKAHRKERDKSNNVFI